MSSCPLSNNERGGAIYKHWEELKNDDFFSGAAKGIKFIYNPRAGTLLY
jgi:hypothetical protein